MPFGEYQPRARLLHRQRIVLDSHCDTTQRLLDGRWRFEERHTFGHVDLPRLRDGGVSAVVLAVFAPHKADAGANVAAATRQFDAIERLARAFPHDVRLCRSAAEVRAAKSAGAIALLVAAEGGHLIEDSLEVLAEYRRRGAVYLTLTHAEHNNWADSRGVHLPVEPRHGGLTDFGRAVIREINRLGMMVDVSHTSEATVQDVLSTSTAPIIASHSSCHAVSPHRRNLSDRLLRRIAEAGGVVQINFASLFIDPHHPPPDVDEFKRRLAAGAEYTEPIWDYRTPLDRLVEHFEHAMRVVGPEHVGIGSDFDGVPAVPADMEHCGMLHNLTAGLLARGWSEDEIGLVLGENFLRVMDACAAAANGSACG